MIIEVIYSPDTGEVTSQRSVLEEQDGGLYINEVVPYPCFVADGVLVRMPERPSSKHTWSWATKTWEDQRTLQELKANGLAGVDDLAGAARLRYITSVPGQAETYAKKEQQARSWEAESFAGAAPSFIAAEAQALNVSAQSVALEVIGLADYWSNIKGPQIEATRRKWKVAIEAASDPSLIQGLVDAARAELDGL
jgi:hypothetical protein